MTDSPLDSKYIAFEDRRHLNILYSQAHRAYHGLPHPSHVFEYMYVIKSKYSNLPDFMFADKIFPTFITAWHDAYYDVGAKDNEVRSAQLWASSVTAAQYKQELVYEIYAGIEASANHWDPANEALSARIQVFLDADIYALGSHYDVFAHDGRNVIKEFSTHFDRDEVIAGRKAWYESILAKERIYWICRDREDQVRRNMERGLKETF